MKTTITLKLLATIIAVAISSGCEKKDADASPAGNAPIPAASASAISAPFAKLQGKWQRPDGGYVIEIRSIESGGTMDAAYFNPQPIHVARAVATDDGGTVKVFVELRDINYPGSTYILAYDSDGDKLSGTYFQAVARETYDVFFDRMKP